MCSNGFHVSNYEHSACSLLQQYAEFQIWLHSQIEVSQSSTIESIKNTKSGRKLAAGFVQKRLQYPSIVCLFSLDSGS